MRVRFRTYCYGCRRGMAWRGRCLWRTHRWDWEYIVSCDGRRLMQRGGFRTWERARKSAERSWVKLAMLSCLGAELSSDQHAP